VFLVFASVPPGLVAERAEATSPLNTTYFHPDRLGSSLVVSDSAAVAMRVVYRPFGALVQNSGGNASVPNRGFTGQRFESTVGVYDYNARWYDPAIARFVQPDALIGSAYDPQQFSPFAHVRNDPVNRIDPTGNESLDCIGGVCLPPNPPTCGGLDYEEITIWGHLTGQVPMSEFEINAWIFGNGFNDGGTNDFLTFTHHNMHMGDYYSDLISQLPGDVEEIVINAPNYSIKTASGRELNPRGFVLDNAAVRLAILAAYYELVGQGGIGFTLEVSGGDRFRTDARTDSTGRSQIRSRTDGSIVGGADPLTRHMIERGATAADLKITSGIGPLAYDAALLLHFSRVATHNGHVHVDLAPWGSPANPLPVGIDRRRRRRSPEGARR